jgi:hypothetical protein
MKDKEQTTDIIERVSTEISYEHGAICAVDCLRQWELGLLNDTILAWKRFLKEVKNKEGSASELRHGAWVPANPL